MKYDQNYWNNKWKKSPILYNGRQLRNRNESLVCDVRNFITINDDILRQVIENFNLKRNSFNDTQYQIQNFVCKFLKYKSDEQTNGLIEFWMFPFETIHQMKLNYGGDCEDGQILTQSLMIQQGIPSYRVKVCQGNVQPEPTQPMGGHQYQLYLTDVNDEIQEWKIYDWCYYPDPDVEPVRKPLQKNGGQKNQYKDVWFTFNNEYSWQQNSLSVDGHIQEKSNEYIDENKKYLTESKETMKFISDRINKKQFYSNKKEIL